MKPIPNAGGTNPEASGGQQNTGPTTHSQTQAQQEQGTKHANEYADESHARKRSLFMRMAPKLRKKAWTLPAPPSSDKEALGDLQAWCSGYVSVFGDGNTWGYWILELLYQLWPRKLYLVGT